MRKEVMNVECGVMNEMRRPHRIHHSSLITEHFKEGHR
jgi:hypothetical protein